jgi:hypothetical protein
LTQGMGIQVDKQEEERRQEENLPRSGALDKFS